MSVLPKFEYTDFHKFLVSVGALFLALALAIPIFLLQTKSALTTPDKIIQGLTPTGRNAALLQQEQVYWLVTWWPITSGIALICGVAFVGWGGYRWKRRQNHLELREQAELEKVNAEKEKVDEEIKQLIKAQRETPEETAEALREKAEEAIEALPASPALSTVQLKQKIHVFEYGANRLEGQIFKNLEETKKAEDEIITHVRFDNGLRADAVLTRAAKEALIVDIRSLRVIFYKKNLQNRISEFISWGLQVKHLAKTEYEGRLYPVCFLIFNPEGFEDPTSERRTEIEKEVQRKVSLHGDAVGMTIFVGWADELDILPSRQIWRITPDDTLRVINFG